MPQDHELELWALGERPARGPRPAYSREQIADAAIKIADAEGLRAASMRRIAAAIGAGTMSLYRYLPTRDDLIELMLDRVMGELDLPERPSDDWRADLTLLARRRRALGLSHPWLAGDPLGRPPMGPNTVRLIEFAMGTLDRYGLHIDEVMSLVGLLEGFLDNFIQEEVRWAERRRTTGEDSFEKAMLKHGPFVRRVVESGRYPTTTRVVIEAQQPHMDPDSRFEYGLARVLHSIAATLPADAAPG